MKTKKAEIAILSIIVLLAGMLYLTGMPFCLLDFSVKNKDLPFDNIFYIVNAFFMSIVVIIVVKLLFKNWIFGFTIKELIKNLICYGKIFFAGIFIVIALSVYIFKPLDRLPLFSEIFFWVVLLNISIAIIEEILLRVLLLKAFEKIFVNNIMLAVIIASAIFGVAHIPTMIQENIYVIIIRVIGTMAVGISLSLIYIKTKNLWTVIVLHFILNSSGTVIYYFSNSNNIYEIAKIWPIPMAIVCIINLLTIKIKQKPALNKR
jgi:membrane protease YdiL (CAAX protease family)